MFPSRAGHGLTTTINRSSSPLSPQGILTILSRIALRADLPPLRPHDLRRTFAAMAREGGAELEMVQHALGHASVATTERYLRQVQNLKEGRTAGDHIKIKSKNL